MLIWSIERDSISCAPHRRSEFGVLRLAAHHVAALLDAVSDLDDLVLQFDGTEAGQRFNEAWRRARIIMDSGSGHSAPPVTPAPAPTPIP